MAIPLNRLSSFPVISDFLEPYDKETEFLTDWQRGGRALQDPSEGLDVQNWQVSLSGSDVVITPETIGSPTTAFTASGEITELSLAFDQNMRPFIAFVEDEVAKYYWYNPITQTNSIEEIAEGATSPRCVLDDVRSTQNDNSRIILAYNRDGNLNYRSQEDRYETEYVLTAAPSRLLKIGMGVNNRLQFLFENPNNIVVPGPTNPPEITIPYWESTAGGFIDLDLATEKTFLEVFGQAFGNDDEINEVVTISEDSGTTPWKVRIDTTDGGNLIQIRDSVGTALAGNLFLVRDNGVVFSSLSWVAGASATDEMSFPTRTPLWLVMASDTDELVIRKRDISPANPEQPPVQPPGGGGNDPTDVTGAVSWSSFFGVADPFNGGPGSIGNQVKQIPAGGISVWFQVPDSPPNKSVNFLAITTTGSAGRPSVSLNTKVQNYSEPVVNNGTQPTFVTGRTDGYTNPTTPPSRTLVLEAGRKYIWNIKMSETGPNGVNWVILNYSTRTQ